MVNTASKFIAKQPFVLENAAAYAEWRAWKKDVFSADPAALSVTIADPFRLDADEIAAIAQRITENSMVVYQLADASESDKGLVHKLGAQFGLERLDSNIRADEDSVTSLEVRPQQGNLYIPYTDKPLSWHTDGYYNLPDRQIRAIVLHCVAPAAEGGVNGLIDHEQVYIRLREEDPRLIEALMHPAAMTIPANEENGEEIRAAQAGPVFSVSETGRLHMRYSARKRNIIWRDDALTQRAAAHITELLADESLVVRTRLEAGQGVLCSNVLHNRTSFEDTESQKRLMYRARYYDEIQLG